MADRFDEMARAWLGLPPDRMGLDDELPTLSALLRKVHDEARAVERRFPVMHGPSVPWRMVEPYEAQAVLNHGQSLARLAERGGLSPRELWLVVRGLGLEARRTVGEADALLWVTAWVEQDRLTQAGLLAARKVVEAARDLLKCCQAPEICGAVLDAERALAEYDKAVGG